MVIAPTLFASWSPPRDATRHTLAKAATATMGPGAPSPSHASHSLREVGNASESAARGACGGRSRPRAQPAREAADGGARTLGQGEPGIDHRIAHLRDARGRSRACGDRKSTRLNSSHVAISYAVFCLKKKKIA